jgi:4-amino-4-deoxy-L-arabinose transferase-like glycosyltransferase
MRQSLVHLKNIFPTSHIHQPGLWWLLFLLLLYGIGQQHSFWLPDEPREAEIAREMYVSGNWAIPRLNGRPFLEKPPLTYWAAAANFWIFDGPSERWCRVPSALWGLIGALATAWLGSMLAGRTVGLLSAFILTTNFEWFFNSHTLHVDMPLAACIVLALAFFWYGHGSEVCAKKRLGYLLCVVAAAGAFLSKGMIGIVLPCAVFFSFLVWRGEWNEISRLISPGNAIVFAIIIIPWTVMLFARLGMDGLRIFLWDNQVLRFLSPAADHAEPTWFYSEKFFEILLPWSIFLLPALLRLVLPWGRESAARRSRQFLIVAIAVPGIILSVASAKRIRYFLPLIPLLSIVIAAWMEKAWAIARTRWEHLWRSVGFYCAAAIVVGVWIFCLFLCLKSGEGLSLAVPGVLLSLLIAVFTVTYNFRTRGVHVARLTVMLIGMSYMVMVLPPVRSFFDSKRSFGPAITDLIADTRSCKKLYGYRLREAEKGAVAFRRGATFDELGTPEELEAALRDGGNGAVLINDEAYAELLSEQRLPAYAAVAGRYDYGKHAISILTASRTDRGKASARNSGEKQAD